jgi:SulP family sulfate permease
MDTSLGKETISKVAVTASAGFVVAIFTVIAAASFASLIFTGPLDSFVPSGIAMALTTAVVGGLIIALTSSSRVAIAIPQDRIAPILALLATSVAANMPLASVQERGMAVIAAVVLVTIITGIFLFVLGRLRLGNLIRYIPYPVIGGFLAGSGWLLVIGGLRVATGLPVRLETLFHSDLFIHWAPAAVFGAGLFWVLRRGTKQFFIPMLLPLAIAIFYAAIGLAGLSAAQARAKGWLPDFGGTAGMHLATLFSVMKSFSWGLLLKNMSTLVTILVTSLVSILLTATALELSLGKDIDLNTELRAAGAASFISGLLGGMVGFHSLSLSRLALSMGARSRWVGVVAAVLCAGVLCVGSAFVSFVPRFICGGLLIFLGVIFLWEWVWEASRKLTRLDYSIVLFILAVVGAVGYTEGVATGIIAAVVLFVHNYSRVDVVSHAMSGAELRSNVDRPVREMKCLREFGEQIYVLHLQGFIFFGTANDLLNDVRIRAEKPGDQPLRYVVMDFRRVTGLDSSAVFSLCKVHQLAVRLGFKLIMTQVSKGIRRQLALGGLHPRDSGAFRLFPDLDYGLEWCEQSLLSACSQPTNGTHSNLPAQLEDIWPKEVPSIRLLPYLESRRVERGQHLIRQSELSESLYFIESGRVTARIEMSNGRSLRLRTMGPGTVVGEVGMFLGGQRMASVVTEADCEVYRLSAQSLDRMRREDPALALAFHQFLIRLLAERLTTMSNMLRGLQEHGRQRKPNSEAEIYKTKVAE